MKKSLLIVAFAFVVTSSFSQTKLLNLDEAILKQKTTLSPRKLPGLQWIKGTDDFCYVDTTKNLNILKRGHATDNVYLDQLTLADLNAELLRNQLETTKKFPALTWINTNQFRFASGAKECIFDLTLKTLSTVDAPLLPENAKNNDEHLVTRMIAYTVENNLFVFDGQKKVSVTNDAEISFVNGQAVHRNEFGITKGTYWSPKGTYLAFYRMDETMVTDYPIIDFTKQPAVANNIKYPMAGSKSHHVTLGIFEVSTGKKWFIKTGGDPEHYLTNIAWSPDEKNIYIAELNRDQNNMQLNCYDVLTGDLSKTLIEEKSEIYVQPEHPVLFVKGDDKKFIWQSARDGWNHLYLYDVSGKLIRQLTTGNYEVTDILGFDKKGQRVYYMSTKEGGITRNLYGYDMKTNVEKKLTEGSGTHKCMMNDDGTYFIDDFQSTITPRDISIVSAFASKKQYLLIADNPLKEYKLGKLKIFTLPASDGTDLYCRQFWPVDFDSTKKYPVIVYVYGGPGVQLINNTWNGGGDLWFQYMAEQGYVVFTLDNRGTNNRGLKFEQVTFKHLGNIELLDQLVGVNYLKSLRYVDQNRMGIFGWSFGGFMTTSMMLRYPDIFKAAVAGGPVIDWSYYEVMYTERYMDTPQTNKAGYEESKITNYVDSLKGKLLMIHGTSDDVVVWQNSIDFVKACVDKGKQVDYFVYPGHLHNVLGKDRAHLFHKITDYFNENLK